MSGATARLAPAFQFHFTAAPAICAEHREGEFRQAMRTEFVTGLQLAVCVSRHKCMSRIAGPAYQSECAVPIMLKRHDSASVIDAKPRHEAAAVPAFVIWMHKRLKLIDCRHRFPVALCSDSHLAEPIVHSAEPLMTLIASRDISAACALVPVGRAAVVDLVHVVSLYGVQLL
jgi:hypothetical protein